MGKLMLETWKLVMIPMIVASIFQASLDLLRRYSLKGGNFSTLQFLSIWYAFTTFLFGIFYITFFGWNFPKHLLSGFWIAVICTTIANIFIQFFKAKASSIDKGEVSFIVPLGAMTPGLITIMAFLLGEFPSKTGMLGVFAMMCGSYILMWEKTPEKWYDYFGPIKRLRLLWNIKNLSPEEKNKTIVVSLALGSAVLGTIGLLFDGLFTRRGVDLQGLSLGAMTMTAILSTIYLVWYLIRPDGKGQFLSLFSKKYLLSLTAISFAWILLVITAYPTYNQTFVAYVGTLKRLGILISVVVGSFYFGEEDFKKRLWATILIVLGAILISTDDLPQKITTEIEKLGL